MYISLCLEAFHALESARGYRKKKKKEEEEAKAFRGNCIHYQYACKSLISREGEKKKKIYFVERVKQDLGINAS